MKFPNQMTIAWDHKDDPVEEFFKAVKFLKNAPDPHLYAHPAFEGSDTYGFIVSRVRMSKREVSTYGRAYWESMRA